MKQSIKILLLITIVLASFTASSQQPAFQHPHQKFASRITVIKSFENNFRFARLKPTQVEEREYLPTGSLIIPADHYTKNFGFFCKEELQLQKRSGMNFSLRLGTLDQCNLLEGKSRGVISR